MTKIFKGDSKFSLYILGYLKKKYPQECVILPKIKKLSDIKHSDVSLRWKEIGNEGYFIFPKNYWEYFRKCTRNRFIIFPFGFDCMNMKGHANYMIYDKKTRSLERFEPYGLAFRKCSNPRMLDERMKELFNMNLGKNFVETYYKPLDFLPKESFQRIQESEGQVLSIDPPGGFCVAWSCWYAELRLLNPDINRNKLVKNALKELKKQGSLTKYIRNYSIQITKLN